MLGDRARVREMSKAEYSVKEYNHSVKSLSAHCIPFETLVDMSSPKAFPLRHTARHNATKYTRRYTYSCLETRAYLSL